MRSQLNAVLACLLFALLPHAANAAVRVVDNNVTVLLPGNVHPLARSGLASQASDSSMPMERMILSLRLSPDKQAALDGFLAAQVDPASPDYHHWLTPEEFGERFGPQPDELATITNWLSSQGFSIDEVAKGRTWINFSGSVSSVESAFHTQMRDYVDGGQMRHANATDPSIPAALADLVSGVVTLHNIPRTSMVARIEPEFTSGGGSHSLSPADFATIYNVNPLYSAGIDGSGQTIAIVGRTHPSSTNWSNFRSVMALPANPPVVVVNGVDPGDIGAGEDGEADLDVEWSGAVAKNASIKFVVSKSTSSTDGVDLSAQYIINNNLAAVMSTSFGSCEADMGSSERAFFNSLWSQAAALGITSFVSSGDSGAAGCSDASASAGSGRAVNGLASTPYNVAVGGTQFNEGSGSYWSSSNGTGGGSALSYIPESAWNESGSVSGGSQLWSSSGGVSSFYSKPSWQAAVGVPSDGSRDVPDVSLSAAAHDGYRVISQGSSFLVSGTSASSPSFAGLMALIVQKTGQRQGNANPRFYQLANAQYGAGGAAIFHDVVSGNNSVPGVTGYSAGTGYDLVTGLGSVDANALAGNWAGTSTSCNYSLSSLSQSASASATAGNVNITTVSSCSWTAVSNASWISVTSGASGSGNGSVAYSIAANTSTASRSGSMTIAGQTYTITQAGAVVSAVLQFAPISYSIAESAGSVTLTVSRSGDTSGTASVNYATCGAGCATLASATPGSDYTATGGTLSFGPGVSSKTISIALLNDNLVEGNETFTVLLSAPVGGSLGSASTATVTILDGQDAQLSLVGRLYNLPSPDNTDVGYLRFYNTGTVSGPVTATLYDQSGNTLGSADLSLSSALAAKGVLALSNADLAARFGVSAWSGRAWMEIKTALPAGTLLMQNLVRSTTLTNMSCVSDSLAVNIPAVGNADQAFIRLYNVGSTAGAVRGTLYDQSGSVLGNANSTLVSSLAGKAVTVLTADLIQSATGAPTWTGRAWLSMTADFGSNLKIMNLIRDSSNTLNNMSCVF